MSDEIKEVLEFSKGSIYSALVNRTPLVLIVDDSQVIRMITTHIVSDAGYQVTEASSAIDALAIVNERRPALVISDALMPKLDGREMCRMIKSNPALSDTKVVLMSGLYTSTRYKIEAMAAFGADDYLAKPVRTAQLLAVLQKFVPMDQAACA